MAIFNLNKDQRDNAVAAIEKLRVAHPSISGRPMEIALPTLTSITDEAKQLKQAIGMVLAAVESDDAATITAAATTFEACAAPLLEAELIRTGWYPKMTSDADKAWLEKAIPAFTQAAAEEATQHLKAARENVITWARA